MRLRWGRFQAAHQLLFVTPGIIPLEANSRKEILERAKRRENERLLPVTRHRFTTRVGLASRGSMLKPT